MVERGTLLVVDDDGDFCRAMTTAFTKRGFTVRTAQDDVRALAMAGEQVPDFAVVDLRLGQRSGLPLVPALKQLNPAMRIVVLTGYASVATAVEAIKLGAIHYLPKPSSAGEILAAMEKEGGDPAVPPAPGKPSLDHLEWEYMQQVLSDCGGNVSAAARTLGIHRRTLQRKMRQRHS